MLLAGAPPWAKALDEMYSDLEDAVDIARSACPQSRCAALGWTWFGDGWAKGRHCFVLLEDGDVSELYVGACLLAFRLRQPGVSVCDGPSVWPMPPYCAVVEQFRDAWGKETSTALLTAGYLAVCEWFDVKGPHLIQRV